MPVQFSAYSYQVSGSQTQKKVGWNEIDFESLNIPLPSDKFLEILYPLDEGVKSAWEHKVKTYYANVLGVYRETNIKKMKQVDYCLENKKS